MIRCEKHDGETYWVCLHEHAAGGVVQGGEKERESGQMHLLKYQKPLFA